MKSIKFIFIACTLFFLWGSASAALPIGSAYQVVGTSGTADRLTNFTFSGTANQITISTGVNSLTWSLPSPLTTVTYNTYVPDVKNSSSSSTWGTKHGWYMKVSDGVHAYVLAWFICTASGNSGTAGSQLVVTLPIAVSTVDNLSYVGNIAVNVAGGTYTNYGILSDGGVYQGGAAVTTQITFCSGFLMYPVAP